MVNGNLCQQKHFVNILKKWLKYIMVFHIKHRTHSLRYGGISQMGAKGVPPEQIRRISGHAPDSKTLISYLKFTNVENASLVKRHIEVT